MTEHGLAVETLLNLIKGPNTPGRERMEALKIWLDRAYGKVVDVSVTGALDTEQTASAMDNLSSDQLESILSLVPSSGHKYEDKPVTSVAYAAPTD